MLRKLKTTILATLLTTAAQAQEGGQLIINELMQSNVDCIMDDTNEFPDSWVELYNQSEKEAQLSDYSLGITPDAAEAWKLPNATIPPQMRVLIYCDKVGEKFHAPFRLDSGKGCEVYLFRNGQLADQVTDLKKQPAPNIGYGRETDGSGRWGYELTPTPGEENGGGICDHDQILGEPVFSEPGRVTTGKQPVALTLSLPEGTPDGTVIRYTTDGTEPTKNSMSYTMALTISSTQVVRAKLFCEGWLSPRSTTHSYIFFPREMTLPVVSIVTDKKYLNDSRLGIFTNNTSNKRVNWRRPINIEFFFGEDQPSSINQLVETRVAGAASRGASKKSMALYANKRFGTKRLDYEFFPDQKPGLTDFKSLVLRNAGNDFDYLYMRDAIVQRTMAVHGDLDWQAWRPAIVYINGTYHGLLNIRERANENNVYTNHGGEEDIDLIENWSDLKEGDWNNFNQFKAFYKEEGHTMAEYEQWMDCREFMNLMMVNIYFNNLDFPGNNSIMWRPRAEGGRWRWIAKDADYTMGIYGDPYTYKYLEWLHNPDYDWYHHWNANAKSVTMLFRHLMDDPDFNREFIDRFAISMGDYLNIDGIREVWDPMYEEISYEYPFHRKLINEWWPNYNDELASGRRWITNRTANFYTQLKNFYKLGTQVAMTVNKDGERDALDITINGVKLSHGIFDGQFWSGRALTIEGASADGTPLYGWKVMEIGSGGQVTTRESEGALLSMEVPECKTLVVTPLTAAANGIRSTDADDSQRRPADVYDLRGRKVRTAGTSTDGLPHGIYIINGKKVVR